MKAIRRFRHYSPGHDSILRSKENQQEQAFFGPGQHDPFFKSGRPVIRRSPEKNDYAPEEEKVQKTAEDKKKEEKVNRLADDKKEEKEVQRTAEGQKEEKEQDKPVQAKLNGAAMVKGIAVHPSGLLVQRGILSSIWKGLKTAGGFIADVVTGAATHAWNLMKSAGAWIWDLVTWLPSRVWSLLKHVGSGIVGTVTWLFNGIKGALAHVWGGVTGVFSWLAGGVSGFFDWIWEGLQRGASWAMRLLHGDFSAIWDGLAGAATWLGSGLKEFLKYGWKGLEAAVIWLTRGAAGFARWIGSGILGALAWLGRLLAKILDIVGIGEIWTLLSEIIKVNTRTMNATEIAEARKVFGGSISYWQVRIDELSLIAWIGALFTGSKGMGVTTAHTINFTRKIHAAPGNNDMIWLIHELTHVSQYTHIGIQYIGEAIHSQATGGYNYGGGAALSGKDLKDFNREQQADIIKHYYAHVLYGSTPYAADYARMKDQAARGRF